MIQHSNHGASVLPAAYAKVSAHWLPKAAPYITYLASCYVKNCL